MVAALLRLARVLVAQTISWVIATYGGLSIPWFPITLGAAINAAMKFVRDKYPNSVILEFLPL